MDFSKTRNKDARLGKRNRGHYLILIVAAVYVGFVLLYKLDSSPLPFDDEGSFLKVAQNYALHGVYADYSIEGDRYTGAIISTGPTVILPIALAFHLFGVSIVIGRLVIVIYTVLFLMMVLALCRTLLNGRFLILIAALIFVSPQIQLDYNGRSVLGEIPGLFYLLLALWIWLRPGRRTVLELFGVGVIVGLACITKNQFALFILPSLFLAMILDLVWYRQRGWLYFVIPGLIAGLIFAGWTYYVFYLLGASVRDVAVDLAVLRGTTNLTILFQSDILNRNLVNTITQTGPLLVPAIVFGGVVSIKRDETGQRWSTLYILMIVSLALYIVSIGWQRYMLPALIFGAFFSGLLLDTLSGGVYFDTRILSRVLNRKRLGPFIAARLTVSGLLIMVLILPVLQQITDIRRNADDSQYRVAQYITQNTPASAIIETTDQSLAILTDRKIHFPPQTSLVDFTKEQFLGIEPAKPYDFREWVNADYVIVPAGSKYYSAASLQNYNQIQTIGRFIIYKQTVGSP